MRQILILCVFVFSCLIYADNKNQRDISVVDFNENEYRIIAKIISMLSSNLSKCSIDPSRSGSGRGGSGGGGFSGGGFGGGGGGGR